METILDDNSVSVTGELSKSSENIKAVSAPLYPAKESHPDLVNTKISAPSYLFSLSESEAPPFLKPGKEPKPKLIIGTIMNPDEAIEMIALLDTDEYGLEHYLKTFLVQKKVIQPYNLSERRFLVLFLRETIDYAAQRDFSSFKLAVLITIYLNSHLYFKWYYWLPPCYLWRYFKELMIRHTIEDSPDGQEVFEPQECYDIVTHFHTVYMNHLPLIHILTFGAFRLKLLWPFKPH